MKRMLGLSFLSLLFYVTTMFAQQPAVGEASKTPVPFLPKGKMAVLDSRVFPDQVNEFKQSISALNQQLELRNKEVQALAEKIIALENTLQTQRLILSPDRLAQMTENLDSMKRDYQRKGTDLRAFAAQEQKRTLDPVVTKLGQFASQYATSHNIVVLMDLGSAIQSRSLLWHDPGIDVTADFVAEYNKENPAPASAPK